MPTKSNTKVDGDALASRRAPARGAKKATAAAAKRRRRSQKKVAKAATKPAGRGPGAEDRGQEHCQGDRDEGPRRGVRPKR